MTTLNEQDSAFAKEVLREEMERAKDMELEIGNLDGYIKRLQELINKLDA